MTSAQESQKLVQSSVVELFTLDATGLGQGTFRFTNQTNAVGSAVVWGGTAFQALPVQGEGWAKSLQGSAPRPLLTVGNTNRFFQAAVIAAGDLVGCPLTRTRVYSKFLDAVNFPGGVNASADSSQVISVETYIIDRKAAHNNTSIQWELCWPIDRPGLKLPLRLILKDFGFPGIGLNS